MDRETPDDDPAPMFDIGPWLVRCRRTLESREATWLDALVDFDQSEGWKDDGRLSCAHWLMASCKMGRSTAYEKVKVAHELRRRPVIGEALAAGEISYSAARTIAVLEDTVPETDEALVNLAKDGTVRDLDRAIDHYLVLHDQEFAGRPPWLRRRRRGVRICHGLGDRLGSADAALNDVELAEFERGLQMFLDRGAGRSVDESVRADAQPPAAGDGANSVVDESRRADYEPDPDGLGAVDDPIGGVDESARLDEALPISWRERRADAFMAMVRTAMAHAQDGHAAGADRYMVHAVTDIGTYEAGRRTELVDGTPLHEEAMDRIMCDCSVVGQLFLNGTEPLALGRKTRVWNTAQRRAIQVRDGGRCRFPGCTWRITDVHHLHDWDHGGPTDVENGALACDSHHTLLHKGYRAEGNANGALTFRRPDGSVLGTSNPPVRASALLRS